jgi:hypothetical protein
MARSTTVSWFKRQQIINCASRNNIGLYLVNTLFNQALLIQSAYLRKAVCLASMLHIGMCWLQFATLPNYRRPA